MIVLAILKALFAVLKLLLSPLNLPPMPGLDSLTELMSYITTMAYNMVYFIMPRGIVQTLLVILLVVIVVRHLYSFVMWIIKKIPMAGMS